MPQLPIWTTSSKPSDIFKKLLARSTQLRFGMGRVGGRPTVRTNARRIVMALLTHGPGGTDYGSAQAGTQNAQTFFSKAICAALDWGFNVFYFEAFDEPWKPASKGLDGSSADETHWGAFTSDRNAKFPLTC